MGDDQLDKKRIDPRQEGGNITRISNTKQIFGQDSIKDAMREEIAISNGEITKHFDHVKVAWRKRNWQLFVSVVSELFGSTEAQQSAEDWMEIVTLMSCQTCGASPDWRWVTTTPAGRLASDREK